jgi:hypothetical protein
MAGTGQGMLQPTKLILSDDFHDNAAIPGYQGTYSAAIAAETLVLFVVPDGCTVEVLDLGVTAVTNIVDTASTTTTDIKFDAGATNLMADAAITGGGGATTTLTAGSTASVGRATVPASGDSGYAFTAAALAVNNQYGPGTIITATLHDEDGSGATGSGLVWVRVKYISKDMGPI